MSPDFDQLAFDILLGLREGLHYRSTVNALAGKDRPAKEAAEIHVAAKIAERLRRGIWRIEQVAANEQFRPPKMPPYF